MTKVGDLAVTNDAAGVVTGDGTYVYEWDPEGRLVEVTPKNRD